MIPGPDQIVACPHCSAVAKYPTLLSGNTFGSKLWTDGKQVSPMLPRTLDVVACHSCGECYWLADASTLGMDDGHDSGSEHVDPAWSHAPYVMEPTTEAYYRALGMGLADTPEQARILRILAWWRGNDTVREAPDSAEAWDASVRQAWCENLEALVPLLDEGIENQLVMKAEIFRELGDFEAALRALARVRAPEYAAVVHQLRVMCESTDRRVRLFQLGG